MFVRTSLFFVARFTLRQRVRFSTQNQGFQCSLFLCELSLKPSLSVVDQGIVLYSQNLYQNQCVLRRSTYIEPVLTSREECNVFADILFQNLFERFCQPACLFLLLDLHLDSPNSREECNEFADLFVLKTIIMLFKRLFVL